MKIVQTFIILLFIPTAFFAQKITEKKESKYRRSSLCTSMIVETNRKYSDVIQRVFLNSPIPDKFNDHRVTPFTIKDGIKNKLQKRSEKIIIQKENIGKYLSNNDIAKQMVAKWFNRAADGSFNMELIAHRGAYDASAMDIELAKSTKRDLTLVADAGEELIKNTFIVVNDFDYVNKEEVSKKARKGLSIINQVALVTGSNINDETTILDTTLKTFGKGYVIRTTSYLYRLAWNDSIAAVFYNDYWMDKNNLDENRKKAFDNSNIFKLEFVGSEVAWADLQSTIFTQKSEEELIAMSTVRAVDAVIAKLQRKYEVFRTKTPLYNTNPLSARIGMKEGLEKGDRFKVLEQVMDNKGRTKYKRRGIIKVDSKHIWDNRYEAGKETNKSNKASNFGFTRFKGSGKFYSGMLIRQIN